MAMYRCGLASEWAFQPLRESEIDNRSARQQREKYHRDIKGGEAVHAGLDAQDCSDGHWLH